MRKVSTYRSLARNRDFTVLWVSATVSELGSRVTLFAMPLVAYAMTGSALWAAASEAVFLVGMVAMLLPAGVLADHRDRLRLMRLSLGSGAVLYASLVVAGLTRHLTVAHLLVVALATGLGNGLFLPAEQSSIRSVVSTEELPTALSQQQARQHVATLTGGPLGGALFGLARWAPFAADLVTYAVGWLLLSRVRADLSPATTGPTARPLHDIGEGLRFLWSRPYLRVLLIWSPATNLVVNALLFVALLRLVEAGFTGWQIGLVQTMTGVCGILGALVAPRIIERTRTGALTILVAWSFVPLSVPLALWNHPATMALAASLGIFLNPAGNAAAGSYRLAITPPELVGRVQSSMQVVSMMAMPLAPLLAGVLLGSLGGREAILALTALSALVALVPTLSRAVRAVPRPAEWPRLTEPAAVPVP